MGEGNAERRGAEWIVAGVCAATLLVLFVAAFRVLDVGSDDRTFIQTFSSDEHRAMHKLQNNLRLHDLNPRAFYNYGYVYHTVSYVPLRVMSWFGVKETDPHLIVTVTRSVSFAAYLALLAAFFQLVRRVQPGLAYPLACTALLASAGTLYRWSHRTHPDVLLALFGVAILWMLHRTSLRRFWLASLWAGLAFGTKASGAYYLVWIAATWVTSRVAAQREGAAAELRLWLRATLPSLVLFFSAWLATNPTVISEYEAFLRDFFREQVHVSRGHGGVREVSVGEWLGALAGTVHPLGLGLLVLGWGALLRFGRDAGGRDDGDPPAALLVGTAVFAAVACGHLFAIVDLKAPRYLMPMLPALVWLAAVGGARALARAPAWAPAAISAAIALPMLSNAWEGVARTHDFPARYEHPRVLAGNWLAEEYPPETRVLLERFSYAPEAHFENLVTVTRVTAEALAAHRAEVVVLNRRKSGRWSWPREGTSFADADFVVSDLDYAAETHALHLALASPGSGWGVVYETPEVVVLARDR